MATEDTSVEITYSIQVPEKSFTLLLELEWFITFTTIDNDFFWDMMMILLGKHKKNLIFYL